MKALIQRVKFAEVRSNDRLLGKIQKGILCFLGIKKGDTNQLADWLAEKIVHLRIFPDQEGKMNLSLLDIQGEILVVSQFTLEADCSHGRRPSFINAQEPQKAEEIYNHFIQKLNSYKIKVESGEFGAEMEVYLINDGPATFILEKNFNGKKD